MVVQSANFGFLTTHDPQLVRLRALAERYFREDPNDEPASVLLERIRAEREAVNADRPKRGRRRA